MEPKQLKLVSGQYSTMYVVVDGDKKGHRIASVSYPITSGGKYSLRISLPGIKNQFEVDSYNDGLEKTKVILKTFASIFYETKPTE